MGGKFDSSTEMIAPATPARQASLAADVGVPVLQSLITGALTGAVVTFLAYQLAPGLDASPFVMWASVSLAISTASWLVLLRETRALLWTAEMKSGRDLDGDGVVGKPSERVIVLNGSKITVPETPKPQETSGFELFVRGLAIKGTAERGWTDIGSKRYAEYRDLLLDHGLARWNSYGVNGKPNKTQGWELTTSADVILKALE